MYKRIFLDANILLDYVETSRPNHHESAQSIKHCLENEITLFTSCDIVTTLYYVHSKNGSSTAVKSILAVSGFCEIVDFSNSEVEEACTLMLSDTAFSDLEDTLQYVLAQKAQCELILTNDKAFVSKMIPKTTSSAFYSEIH